MMSIDPFAQVLELIGDARLVLLGEASHGTDEFYRTRAEITKRLIAERGFTAVAAEADWPDAYRVNAYARGRGHDSTAEESLRGFERFPSWMWRNSVVLEFIEWLRAYNETAFGHPAGFYGLDLYSMYASMEAVLTYLKRVDPGAARIARERYACFDWVGGDAQRYGYAAGVAGAESCEDEAVAELLELRRNAPTYASLDGRVAEEDAFAAEQNARVAVDAERYYREMYRGEVSSWNLRDTHMMQTLIELFSFLDRAAPAKIVVWAHNSHLGDARATQMGQRGELNLGQVVRQRWGDWARLIGFTTYDGTVTAASNWDNPAEVKHVRPALDGSYERLFHESGRGRFFVEPSRIDQLHQPHLERAIGVIYRPETERQSHYFYAQLSRQFDGVIHIDRTTALEPLEGWEPIGREPPETFPTAV